jgi:hypothetical protein
MSACKLLNDTISTVKVSVEWREGLGMYDAWKGKEVVVVFFKMLFWHLPERTERNHKTLRIADILAEI